MRAPRPPCRHAPTPCLADRTAICLSKHARTISTRLHTADVVVPSHIRDPGGEPGCLTSLTLGIPARRTSTNARPGFQHVVAVCAINHAGLLGSITIRSLDNGAMVQEARKHIRDVNNIAGVVIGSRLRSNNAGPSVSVSCCLAETAESCGWSSLTSIQ